MASYDLSQLAGKTLVAKARTGVYTFASDDATPSYFVEKGASVGVIYSVLTPNSHRSGTWFMLEAVGGSYRYVKADPDKLSESSLRDQGARTEAEIEAEKQKEKEKFENPFMYYFKEYFLKYLPKILIIGVVLFFIPNIVSSAKEVMPNGQRLNRFRRRLSYR